jgi:hypothetical protein
VEVVTRLGFVSFSEGRALASLRFSSEKRLTLTHSWRYVGESRMLFGSCEAKFWVRGCSRGVLSESCWCWFLGDYVFCCKDIYMTRVVVKTVDTTSTPTSTLASNPTAPIAFLPSTTHPFYERFGR